MKRFVFSTLLIIVLFTAGFTQEPKNTPMGEKIEADKNGISDADKKAIADIIDKLKSDETAESELYTEIIEIYKRIGNLLIDELTELKKTDEESVSKILSHIKTYQKTECERLCTVFDLFSMPELKGKKFVKFNTGHLNGQNDSETKDTDKINFFYVEGWLVSENENEVRIYDSHMNEYSFPINKKLPDNWDKYKDSHPKDSPLPGFYTEINFAKYCEDYAPDDETSGIFETSVLAYWALKLDLIDVSYKLFKLANYERQKQYQYRNWTVIDVVTLGLANDIRYEVIKEANEGTPRPKLLKKWEILSKLPKHRYSDEAANMVKMLKTMIVEDEKWKEPTEEDFKKMTPAEQAEYWMYKLRDHNATQLMNPGSCSVFELFDSYDGDPKNPAEELKLLDIDATAILIEHMDDPRPTRCVGFHRSYDSSSYYHLYIGDICEQIFEAISGINIYTRQNTSGSMMRDGKASEAKKKAQEWWKEYQKSTCEKTVDTFDELDLPDIRDKKFIVFNKLRWLQDYSDDSLDTEDIHFNFVLGWLISEEDGKIKILSTTLMIETYETLKKLPPKWEKYKEENPDKTPLPGFYKEIDYKGFCRDRLDKKFAWDSSVGDFSEHNDQGKPVKPKFRRYLSEGRFSHISETCLYAYWALKRGLVDIAYDLVQHATKITNDVPMYKNSSPSFITWQELIINVRWQAITIANNGAPRPEVLRKWQTLLKIDPVAVESEATEMIELLQKMIEEDKKWKEPSEEEFKKMTPAEQAEYWMYKLRDCHTQQLGNPGSCIVFNPGRFTNKDEKNPADELVKLDLDAIPLLIEHIDDPRPTRCVGFWRSYRIHSYYHLFYGDACQQIFEAISGIQIYKRKSTSGTMMKDSKAVEAKKKAQEWWDYYQKNANKQFLTDGIAKGDSSAVPYARRFLKQYPDEAFDVIAKGINNATDARIKTSLIDILSNIEGDATINLFVEEVKSAKDYIYKLSIVRHLHKLDPKIELKVLLEEINSFSVDDEGFGLFSFLDYLCDIGEPIVIKTIRNNFDKMSKDNQLSIVRIFDNKVSSDNSNDNTEQIKKKEYFKEIETLLIKALDYESPSGLGSGKNWHGKAYHRPRLCDIAAHILQYRHPEKYDFDISDSIENRNEQITTIKSTWQSSNTAPLQTKPAKE